MKAIAAFLLIATLSTAFSSAAIHQSLAEIDKDPIGNVILSALSLNLKAKVPLEDVNALLKELKGDLSNDLETLNENYESLSNRLQGSIENGQSLINSYDISIQGLERAISSKNSEKDSKSNELRNTRDSLKFEVERLKALEDSYQLFIPNVDADIQSLTDASSALQNAVTKLQIFSASNNGATALLEVSSTTQKEIKKLAENVEKVKVTLAKRSNLYLPLVRELLEMTANIDQSKTERLAELLNQLADLISGALADAKEQKRKFVEDYEKEKDEAETNRDNYEIHIKQLEDDIKGLENDIQANQEELALEKGFRNDATAKLEQDKQALASATAEHDDQEARYEKLIALVEKIITHFGENIAAVDQYTQDRLENGF